MTDSRLAGIIGLGVIGGSIARALRQAGWSVSGMDSDPATTARALELGYITSAGIDPRSSIVFIAVPVLSVEAEVRHAAAVTNCPITDVGSVKTHITNALADIPDFVAGHPMAGNEFNKLDGADPNLFDGATWILTPGAATSERAYVQVAAIISGVMRAKVITMAAERHDSMLAAVSHVPHMVAAALMLAAVTEAGPDTQALHAVAAGGFRDMTRISAGNPDIWLDIATQNRDAITRVLDDVIENLDVLKKVISTADTPKLRTMLAAAQNDRRALPQRVINRYAELFVPVQDRVGVLKEVTILATDLGVNILDIDIEHASEGQRGTLRLMVPEADADRFYGGLRARGYAPQVVRSTPGSQTQ